MTRLISMPIIGKDMCFHAIAQEKYIKEEKNILRKNRVRFTTQLWEVFKVK